MDLGNLDTGQAIGASTSTECPSGAYFEDVDGLALERMITRAQPRIREIVTQYLQLRPEVNHAQDPLFKNLPIEIISRVFELCFDPLPVLVSGQSKSYFPSMFSPLHLGGICRTWRDIAWSNPRLWVYVPIPLSSKLFTSSVGYNIVKEWLERTGALPLFITVYQHGGYDPQQLPTLEQLDPVIVLINEYFQRCRVVDIILPSGLLAHFKQEPRNDHQSYIEVECLKLGISDVNDISGHYSVEMRGIAPRDLWIAGIRYETLGIEWVNITTLLACKIYSDEIVQIIINCPRMTHCTLRNVRHRLVQRVPSPHNPYPHIHNSLMFLGFEPEVPEASDIFFDITLPSLASMFIGWPGTPGTPFLSNIAQFLQRSSSPLERVCLILPRVSARSILNLLHYLPFVVELIIWKPYTRTLWKDVFNHFGQSCVSRRCKLYTSKDVLLPRLKYLTHYQPEHGEALSRDWNLILGILETSLRRNPAYILGLDKLGITHDACLEDLSKKFEKDEKNLDRLVELVLAGVSLEIRGSDRNLMQLPKLDLIQLRERVSRMNNSKNNVLGRLLNFFGTKDKKETVQ